MILRDNLVIDDVHITEIDEIYEMLDILDIGNDDVVYIEIDDDLMIQCLWMYMFFNKHADEILYTEDDEAYVQQEYSDDIDDGQYIEIDELYIVRADMHLLHELEVQQCFEHEDHEADDVIVLLPLVDEILFMGIDDPRLDAELDEIELIDELDHRNVNIE